MGFNMRNKPTYTTKLHAHRLSLMMLRDEPCGCCPAAPEFYFERRSMAQLWKNCPCFICRDFVDIKDSAKCPCTSLGEKKAITRTHKKLKEYYKGG